eukprot:15463520-Alexandrium_andersonii.AAC.1
MFASESRRGPCGPVGELGQRPPREGVWRKQLALTTGSDKRAWLIRPMSSCACEQLTGIFTSQAAQSAIRNLPKA